MRVAEADHPSRVADSVYGDHHVERFENRRAPRRSRAREPKPENGFRGPDTGDRRRAPAISANEFVKGLAEDQRAYQRTCVWRLRGARRGPASRALLQTNSERINRQVSKPSNNAKQSSLEDAFWHGIGHDCDGGSATQSGIRSNELLATKKARHGEMVDQRARR